LKCELTESWQINSTKIYQLFVPAHLPDDSVPQNHSYDRNSIRESHLELPSKLEEPINALRSPQIPGIIRASFDSKICEAVSAQLGTFVWQL
jgi:hypothetical protein